MRETAIRRTAHLAEFAVLGAERVGTQASRPVIAQPFSEAVQVSQRNLEAMAALIRIEWSVGQVHNLRREVNLTHRLDEWGRTVIGIEPSEVEQLRRELKMAIRAGDCRYLGLEYRAG